MELTHLDKACIFCERNDIKIGAYVRPEYPTYSVKKYVNGKARTVSLHKVKVEINIGNSIILSDQFYNQENELTEAVQRLKIFYYDRYLQSEKAKASK